MDGWMIFGLVVGALVAGFVVGFFVGGKHKEKLMANVGQAANDLSDKIRNAGNKL